MPDVIAYHLPQFHSIPENDLWHGKGFTEWTNVHRAAPLFPGHKQPRSPHYSLGYYNLLDPVARVKQATIAEANGVSAFCYWHYWFGRGRTILEKPLQLLLESDEPSLRFCLAWANESWKGRYHGVADGTTLVSQEYPGENDHLLHFESLRPYFEDGRYYLVDGKPLFVIYQPTEIPNIARFIALWREAAVRCGLPGIHLVAHTFQEESAPGLVREGFDAVNYVPLFNALGRLPTRITGMNVFRHRDVIVYWRPSAADDFTRLYPTLIPNWDTTPRQGPYGMIIAENDPSTFGQHVTTVLALSDLQGLKPQIVFVKSWNEWAEGNYLEPDEDFGYEYLRELRERL